MEADSAIVIKAGLIFRTGAFPPLLRRFTKHVVGSRIGRHFMSVEVPTRWHYHFARWVAVKFNLVDNFCDFEFYFDLF